MKNFKGLIGITALLGLLTVALSYHCNSGPKDKTTLVKDEPMKFAAGIVVAPDSVKITPAGDTIKYYHTSKTGTGTVPAQSYTYNYDVPYVVVIPKGSTTPPPIDTIPDPPVGGQTYPLIFNAATVDNRPGAGFEQWHDRLEVNLGYTPQDVYYRFVSTRIATATRGVYNWSYFDNLINQAKAKGQKFSFGIMTSYPEGTTNEGLINIDGGTASYPAWLQSAMQGEWKINGSWVANYNDPVYLAWIKELNVAINDHLISTGNFKVINYIDIRSYGSWGEWHSANLADNFKVSQYPPGTFPTLASLQKIVDAYREGFPNIQLSAMLAAFDCQRLDNTWNPPGIAYYVLMQRNQKGFIGWRRDQWGGTDTYPDDYLKNNNNVVNGLRLKDSIMVKYRQAPVTGEPPGWNANDYADLQRQVNDYSPTSIGDGNFGSVNGTVTNRVNTASKSMGYKLSPTGGSIVTGSGAIQFILNWSNPGKSPSYDNWNVTFELLGSSGTVVKTFTSKFRPRLFMGTATINETFSAAGLSGNYTVRMKVIDADGYRKPMPLQITGQNTDGSYTLKNVTL